MDSKPERLGDILKRVVADLDPHTKPEPGSPRAAMVDFFRKQPKKHQPPPAAIVSVDPATGNDRTTRATVELGPNGRPRVTRIEHFDDQPPPPEPPGQPIETTELGEEPF